MWQRFALDERNDLVFDPFVGVGSAAIAALMHNRRFLGYELDKNYIQLAEERIKKLKNGTLKIRPLGKPVYQPTGKEKVSQIPVEWNNL